MASATLEMIIDLVGVNKAARGFKKISSGLKLFNDEAEQGSKKAKKFGSSLSGLQKTAVAGGAIFATKALFDFSKGAVDAAVSADEAAAAFGTTFGTAAERATRFLEEFANKAGLTVGEAQQLQATLGAVAQGIGFTQEESADLAIELTKVAADVASFSNISAGAEPVLRAFQSALLGENEALKTYGIAILSSEVNTRALQLTSKNTAEQLNKQEKALATLSLINEKAAVQIGDLDRTFLSFANQSRAVGAELRSIREEIGKQLIPALEVLLPKFRDLIDNVAPSLIAGFGDAAGAVIDLVLALDRLGDIDGNIFDLINNFRELADEQRFINEITDRTADKTNLLGIQTAFLAKEQQKQRQQQQNQRVAFEKFDTVLKKSSIPQLKIYLELIKGLAGEDEVLTDAEDELTEAKDRVSEAQRREALATAEERLQKKELQAQIQELLFFQEKGIDVSEELAVAQEKLKLVEFELTRESEDLRNAKKDLADIEEQLKPLVDNTTESFEEQVETFIKLNEKSEAFKQLLLNEEFRRIASASGELNPFIKDSLDILSDLASLQGLNNRAQELNNFARAAERLAAAQSGATSNVPRVSVSSPSPSRAFIPNTATQLSDARLSNIANNIDVKVQIGEEEFDAAVETSSQRSQDRSAFFSRLVAAGAE
tara:strand:- start:155 stop:2134 length:1980 start_codon:yes stop_codon:yes gene_type:complete